MNEASTVERKLAAILIADVEAYSRHMHEDEEQALTTLTRHRAIMDDLIARHAGNVTGTAGDSVIADFSSAVEAVNCAVAIQQALFKANRKLVAHQRMEFRIGINVGDVMLKDGDIFGDGINVAARIEALAEPGGICVTRQTRDNVRDKVAYRFEDMGEQEVKNIARPVRAFRLVFDRAGSQAPEPPDAAKEEAPPSRKPLDPLAVEIEIAFWNSVKDSHDAEMLKAYLDKYPEGEFKPLALIGLARLG